MLEYRNCHAIRTGATMPTHTLLVGNGKISIIHMNNLNQESIIRNIDKNGFIPVAIAYDTEQNKYTIYSNDNGIIAIIDECIKPLTIPEIIEKYNLPMTEQEYKRIFQIP